MDSRLYICILFLLLYLILSQQKSERKVKNLAKCCCFILFLEAGLRHANVGPDTPTYFMLFENIKEQSWTYLFSKYYSCYVLRIARDPSYSIIVKPFTYITNGWQIFLLFASGVYFYALYKFLTRYVKSLSGMLLAFTFCISLFHIIPLSGMRQLFTMAIAMLLPPLVEKKKLITYIIVILVGSTIHTSLLFVLPLYFIYHFFQAYSKKLIILSFLCMPIVAFGSNVIIKYLADFSGNEYYSGYVSEESSGALNYIIFFTLIIMISIYYFDKVNMKEQKLFCSALIMIPLTVPLIVSNGAMIRIGQYYTIYAALFLPYVIQHSRNKLLYCAVIAALLYLTFKNEFYYHFFWEDIALNFIYK